MRDARPILWLQCLLLADFVSAPAVAAPPALTHPATFVSPPPAGSPTSTPTAPKPVPPQSLLNACPTTRDYVGRVVAAVMINGKGPFRFIVDTGANESTMSPELAATLGLAADADSRVRVAGVTGTEIVPWVPIESLQAGALVMGHSQLPIISSPILIGADGILGAAGLTEDSLLVDFERNTVTIRGASETFMPGGFTQVRATRLPGGLLSVPGEVGGVPVDAIIDTGSPQTLANLALYRALYASAKATGIASVLGVTKQVRPGNVQTAPSLDLGAIRIGNAVLIYGDFPIFKVWSLTTRPAIILGMDVLGTVDAFVIDFRHATFGIEPRDMSPGVHPGWTDMSQQ